VPSGATALDVTLSGGTGDADLYVRYGAVPTDADYDCRPYLIGNEEVCTIPSPTAGTWYIRVAAYTDFSGATLVGTSQ